MWLVLVWLDKSPVFRSSIIQMSGSYYLLGKKIELELELERFIFIVNGYKFTLLKKYIRKIVHICI